MPKILIKIFRSIFVSFHFYDSNLEKNNLDFIINQNNNDDNNNSNNSYFPNIIISKETFINLNNNNFIKNSEELNELYKQFIIILFKNGTENQNKNIFNIFKKFYEKETDSVLKAGYPKNFYKFGDLFKTIFIPAMISFNNEYENIENKDIILSIKKYLSRNEVDGQKIGGTIQHIYEELVPQIPDFENLLKDKIDKYYNIIFIELLYLFFVKENNGNFWQFLTEIRKGVIKYFGTIFLNDLKNKSFEEIHTSLIDYIKFNFDLTYPSDLKISIQFLYNLSNFILNELYPQKLIYFIPKIIILRFKDAINCIYHSFSFIKIIYDISKNYEFNLSNIEKSMELNKKCFGKFLSILIKIIGDKNIKNLNLKCQIVNFLIIDIDKVEYFSDEDLNSIFNFFNLIHNNSDYKQYINAFLTTIFHDKIYLKSKEYYNLGKRINELFKNNKNFLRVIIQLLYNNMNESLSKLEEKFSEYKNNQINIINNNNFQNNNNINNNNIQNNNINNNNNQINNINNNNNNQNNNIVLSDEDKLILLEKSFDDVGNQFLNLIHFYQISPDIKELYDSKSLENKYLISFLLNLYNIIFSKNNIQKIDDKNEHYKNLLNKVNEFYNIIISNIVNQNDQDILKEISKQRNILQFKEILQNLERFNPVKDGQDDKYKYFKDFMEQLEKLVPEEEVINKIDFDNNKEMTKSGRIIEINLIYAQTLS